MKTVLLAVSAVLFAFAGEAVAQPGSAAPAAGSAAAPPASEPPTMSAAPALPDASDARKACTAAMNADPQFAAAIVKVADEKAAKQRDDDLLAAHQAADARIKQNEIHVIYAYAGLWIIAAAFVLFLWRRQEGLKSEIATLRRDLEAAGADSTAKARP